MDEQELENMLKPFGQVISTRILRDSSGTSRGVGFARYLGGVSHAGSLLPLFWLKRQEYLQMIKFVKRRQIEMDEQTQQGFVNSSFGKAVSPLA